MPEPSVASESNLSGVFKFKALGHQSHNSEPILSLSSEPASPIIKSPNTETPQTESSEFMFPIPVPTPESNFPDLTSSQTRNSDTSAAESMLQEGHRILSGSKEPVLKSLMKLTSKTTNSVDLTRFINVYIDITSEATIVCADLAVGMSLSDYSITWRLSSIDFTLENIVVLERKNLPTKRVDGIFGSSFLRLFSYMTFKNVSEQYVLPSRFSIAYPLLPPPNSQRTLRVYTAIAISSSDLALNSETRHSRPFVGVGVFFEQRVSMNTWIPYFLDDPALQPKPDSAGTQYMLELAIFETFIAIIEVVLGKSNLSPFCRVEFYTEQKALVSWWKPVGQSSREGRGLVGKFCPPPERHTYFMNLRKKFATDVNSNELDCFHILSYTDGDEAKQAQLEFAGEQAAILADLAIKASRERIFDRDFYTRFLPNGPVRVLKLRVRVALSKIHLAYEGCAKEVSNSQVVAISSSRLAPKKRKENASNPGKPADNEDSGGKDLERLRSPKPSYQDRKENWRDVKAANDYSDIKTITDIREREGGAQKILSFLRTNDISSQFSTPNMTTKDAALNRTDYVARGKEGEIIYTMGTPREDAEITRLKAERGYNPRIKEFTAQSLTVQNTPYDHANTLAPVAQGTVGSITTAEDMTKRIEGEKDARFGASKILKAEYNSGRNTNEVKKLLLIPIEKGTARREEAQRQWAEAEARRIISEAQTEAAEILSQAKSVWTEGINSQLMASATASKICSDAEAEAQRIKLQAFYVVRNFEQQRERIFGVTSNLNPMAPGPENAEIESDPILEEVRNRVAEAQAEEIMKHAEEIKREAEIKMAEQIEKANREAGAEMEKIQKDAEEMKKMKRDTEAEIEKTRKDAEETRRWAEKMKRDVKVEVEKSRKDAEEVMGEAQKIREQAYKTKVDQEDMRKAERLKDDQESLKMTERIRSKVDKITQQEAELKKTKEMVENVKKEAEAMKRDAETAIAKARVDADNIIAEAQRVKKEAEGTKMRAVRISEKIKAEAKEESNKMKAYAEKVLKEAEKEKEDAEAKAKKTIEEGKQIRKDSEMAFTLMMENEKAEALRFQTEESSRKIAEAVKRQDDKRKKSEERIKNEHKKREEEWNRKVKLEKDILGESLSRIASQKKKAEEEAQEIVTKAKEEAAQIIQDAIQAQDDHPIRGDVLGSALPLTPEGFYKMFLELPDGVEASPLSPLEFINILENSKAGVTLGQIVNHCPEAARLFLDQCKSEERLVHDIELFTSRLDGRLKFKKGERIIKTSRGGRCEIVSPL